MKKYNVETWNSPPIMEVEITRETESSVWFMRNGRERRAAKRDYYNTWQEAKDSILAKKLAQLENAKRQVEYYEKEYQKYLALKP